jgi:spore germination cell wall hydrolase CwlJ-like protein
MHLIDPRSLAIVTIILEAAHEPYEGQLGVAEVIRNRMLQHYESDGSVAGTVLKAGQFSCWNTHDPRRARISQLDDKDPQARIAAAVWDRATLNDPESPAASTAKGALLYYAPAAMQPPGAVPIWVPACDWLVDLGTQKFYKPKPVVARDANV